MSLKCGCFHFLLSWGAPWAVCVWQFANVEAEHGLPPGRTSSAPVPRSCPPWSGVEHVKIHVVKMTQGSLKSHMNFWPNWGRRAFSEGESPLQLSWAWGSGGACVRFPGERHLLLCTVYEVCGPATSECFLFFVFHAVFLFIVFKCAFQFGFFFSSFLFKILQTACHKSCSKKSHKCKKCYSKCISVYWCICVYTWWYCIFTG